MARLRIRTPDLATVGVSPYAGKNTLRSLTAGAIPLIRARGASPVTTGARRRHCCRRSHESPAMGLWAGGDRCISSRGDGAELPRACAYLCRSEVGAVGATGEHAGQSILFLPTWAVGAGGSVKMSQPHHSQVTAGQMHNRLLSQVLPPNPPLEREPSVTRNIHRVARLGKRRPVRCVPWLNEGLSLSRQTSGGVECREPVMLEVESWRHTSTAPPHGMLRRGSG